LESKSPSAGRRLKCAGDMLRPVSVRVAPSAVASRWSSSQAGAPRKRSRPKNVVPPRQPVKPSKPPSKPSKPALEQALEGLCLLDHVASPTKLLDLARRAEPKWKAAHSDPKVDLPPKLDWAKHFPLNSLVRDRVCIRDATTADAVAEAFVPSGSRGKVIVEAFPGMPVSVHSWVG
jgi:hypothetical protein